RDGKDSLPARITPGFGDDTFLRGQVPMTKEEVREISICKLHLTERAVVYDVGSGTGSIAMEVAALSPWIQVYAIECQDEAIALIQANKEARGAFNVKVVQAVAPEGMAELPAPTHVFVGGSKGNLQGILSAVYQKNPRARIVMNAISLESIAQMQEMVKEWPVADLEITTVSVSKAKKAGAYHLMQAANPVTIFSFTFQEER
ncbi:MAG: precorrin-6Y C5,15-methyltransferase (decarboxylating) subunit CbiT, partial [Lachnospiraceae bacterium]|nr:precorrin-6Y C5,15-methyltransferase (decarboxylating) subunit CbiT [Lachnospiraceae bacterium]